MLRKVFSVILFIMCISFFTSCAPTIHPMAYTVGDTQDVHFFSYNDGPDEGSIRFDSADYELNEDGETAQLICSFTFYPKRTIYLDTSKIYIFRGVYDEHYYTDTQLNSEKNGRDITDLTIEEETTIILYFIIPKSPYFDNLADNIPECDNNHMLTCFIESTCSKINYDIFTGELSDKMKK